MENAKKWIIIACLLGAAVLILLTNTSILNKVLVCIVAAVGIVALLPSVLAKK